MTWYNFAMKILQRVKLAPYTTFHVGGKAKFFAEVSSVDELKEALSFAKAKKLPIFILGGGSNLVVSDKGFAGLVVVPTFLGKKVIKRGKNYVDVRVGAGENWDKFVAWCIQKKFHGIENMSHVPGKVGASAVQNIGAYGQEVSETLLSAESIDTKTQSHVVVKVQDMNMGYRSSMFNQEKNKGRFVLTHLTFRLKLNAPLCLEYGDVQRFFAGHPKLKPSLKTMRRAVTEIRDAKYPFPDHPAKGSAGSFFKADSAKTPVFSSIVKKLKALGFEDKAAYLERMKKSFEVKQGYKVPYGILIDALGLKGRKVGGVKVLETHAGVLLNFTGKAKAQDILLLAFGVKKAVKKAFGVNLLFEPELVGFSRVEIRSLERRAKLL